MAERTRTWYAPLEKPAKNENSFPKERLDVLTEQIYLIARFIMIREPAIGVEDDGFKIPSQFVSVLCEDHDGTPYHATAWLNI